VHAAALTFQYESLSAYTRIFLAFCPVVGDASLPNDHTHIAFTLGSSSGTYKLLISHSTQYSPSGKPIVPIAAAITSLTYGFSSFNNC